MFELDAAIREWRLSLGESIGEDHRDELEQHLRSLVAELTVGDLSPEEAYLVARHRMGSTGELEGEFSKVHTDALWIGRMQWMVLGFLGINAIVAALRMAVELSVWSAGVFGLGSVGTVGGQAAVLIFGLISLVWVFFRIVRARRPEGRGLVLLSLLLALAAPFFMVGRGMVVIGQSRALAVQEMRDVILYRAYVAPAMALLLPLGLAYVVYRLHKRRLLT